VSSRSVNFRIDICCFHDRVLLFHDFFWIKQDLHEGEFVFFEGYFRGKLEIQLDILNKMNRLKISAKTNRMEKNKKSIILPIMKNERSRLKFLLLLVFVTITASSFAQVIFENPISGSNPGNSNPYTNGQSSNANVTVSGIGRGSGVSGSNGNNRYNSSNWSTGSSFDNNDFFTWTITPASCYEIDFQSLVLSFERSSSGPQNLAIRTSLDNYSSVIWNYSLNNNSVQTETISLAGANFQNLTSGITFRIYGWNAGGGSGTFSVNSFVFNGSVNSLNTAVAGTISGTNSVCSGSNTTIALSGNTGNIQWQSSTDNVTFTNINSATSATYTTSNITETTYYRAGSTVGSCPTIFSSSYTVGITSPSLTAVNGSRCGTGTVNLGVSQICLPAGATINWFAAPTGGSSLGTGNSFTTPVINATTTYYASTTVITGNTTIGSNDGDNDDTGLIFTANTPFVLNSVQVFSDANGSMTVQLFNSSGDAISGFPAITFPLVTGINTLNLNWNIPVGSNYQILATNISDNVDLSRTNDFTWPLGLSGFGAIVEEIGSGNHYNYFYNWNISSPRIPVVATINASTAPTFTEVATICSGGTLNALPTTSNNSITGTWSPALNNAATTTYTFTPTAGQCASTATMTITVTPLSSNTTTVLACDNYTWSVNGTTYTTSGTYTSVTGCHTETLVLTITPSTNNTTTASACDSYTWSENGTTYTANGTYTSVTGCHTETLVLTINASSIYYVDGDGDGFGSTTTASFCAMPSTGYSLNNTDCDDAVASIYPGATELCNGVDDNCDGFIDEGCPSTIAGEEPFNSLSAPSSMYSYCSSFYGTLAGAFPSTLAQSTCITGEDRWYNFTTLTSGVTIFIGSNANDIVIELQDENGNIIDVENIINGIGTEVLTKTGLTVGATYRVGIRNYNSNAQAGGQFSGCIRHLRSGGSDSGTSSTWPSTLSTCSLLKAIYCGGTGVQYRYTWTGISGSATGQVFTRTQTSDYLNVTAVSPSLHAGCTYNVLVTAIYSIPNGTGTIEVFELAAYTPTAINILPVSNVALRSTDQMSNGPRYRGSVIAALPWVCGITNWRWRFTEVNPLTLQAVGLPIEQNRGAASNYINLNNVAALQFGKTYAVQSAPLLSYSGTNYQWGPVAYMAIIGSAGMVVDSAEGASQGSEKDVLQDAIQDSSKGATQGPSEDLAQEMELTVFPNPSNGSNLNLNISGIESDNVQVKIYDSMGRKIQSERYSVNGTLQTELNFQSELTSGIYLVEVSSENIVKTVRVLIEK